MPPGLNLRKQAERERLTSTGEGQDLSHIVHLALRLVLMLQRRLGSRSSAWSDKLDSATVRQTCHALEALRMLYWEALAESIDNGVAWLINLSDHRRQDDDEPTTALYNNPSRFKTLAWLGRLESRTLQAEFDDLLATLDEARARLQTPKALLALMTCLDCLNHLAAHQELSRTQQNKRVALLHTLRQQFQGWLTVEGNGANTAPLLRTEELGEISYAFDLLVRNGELPLNAPQSILLHGAMLKALNDAVTRLHELPTSSDLYYCAIQLATHFVDDNETQQALYRFFDFVYHRYTEDRLEDDEKFPHPLVLRALLHWQSDWSRTQLIGTLLAHEALTQEREWQRAEDERRAAIEKLLRQRLKFDIRKITPLTGGLTKAEVLRVDFWVKFHGLEDNGESSPTIPTSYSMVIKHGSLDVLNRALTRYRQLPEGVKYYFARHSGEHKGEAGQGLPSSYIALEDLTESFRTYRDIFNALDHTVLSKPQQDRLDRSCAVIAKGLFDIHRQCKQNGDFRHAGSQLSRLYLGPIEKHLLNIGKIKKFAQLRPFLHGFRLQTPRAAQMEMKGIEYYLNKLEQARNRLRLPFLTMIHGDCHSRNLMLDDQLSRMKLIDLERLETGSDYLLDFAELIEDVAGWRYVSDSECTLRLVKSSIQLKSSPPMEIKPHHIRYNPIGSPASRRFQTMMLRNLENFAAESKDESWRYRLWLGLGLHLLSLVDKHPDLSYATVIYAEAIRLFDDLVFALDKNTSLPTLPFPEEHVSLQQSYAQQLDESPEQRLLAALDLAIAALDEQIQATPAHPPFRVRRYYFYQPNQPPKFFAVLDARSEKPHLLLACSRKDIYDPNHITGRANAGEHFKTVIQIDEDADPAAIMKIVKQVVDQIVSSREF